MVNNIYVPINMLYLNNHNFLKLIFQKPPFVRHSKFPQLLTENFQISYFHTNMAPKKKIIRTEPQIRHEHTVFLSETTNIDTLEILDIFKRRGWKHFLTYQPRKYMDEQVLQFYTSILHDDVHNLLVADVVVEIYGDLEASFE